MSISLNAQNVVVSYDWEDGKKQPEGLTITIDDSWRCGVTNQNVIDGSFSFYARKTDNNSNQKMTIKTSAVAKSLYQLEFYSKTSQLKIEASLDNTDATFDTVPIGGGFYYYCFSVYVESNLPLSYVVDFKDAPSFTLIDDMTITQYEFGGSYVTENESDFVKELVAIELGEKKTGVSASDFQVFVNGKPNKVNGAKAYDGFMYLIVEESVRGNVEVKYVGKEASWNGYSAIATDVTDINGIDLFSYVGTDYLDVDCLNIVTESSEGGSVTTGGVYFAGTKLEITAQPWLNYKFVAWQDGDSSITKTFVVDTSCILSAEFEPMEYLVSAMAFPAEMGQVSGTAYYSYGTNAELIAQSNPGYVFIGWQNGDERILSDTLKVEVKSNAQFYTALFAYEVTAVSNNYEMGSVNVVYHSSTQATITAVPERGYHFVSWSDGGEAEHLVNVNSATIFEAIFAKNDITDIAESEMLANITGGIGQITVDAICPSDICVYNIEGILVAIQKNTTSAVILVKQGVYIVRVGNVARKMIVR